MSAAHSVQKALQEKGFSVDAIVVPVMWRPREGLPGDYEPLKYLESTLAEDWRDQSCMEGTGRGFTTNTELAKKKPSLFSTGMAKDLLPVGTLIGNGIRLCDESVTVEEDDEDAEDAEIIHKRVLLERQVIVRCARHKLGYVVNKEISDMQPLLPSDRASACEAARGLCVETGVPEMLRGAVEHACEHCTSLVIDFRACVRHLHRHFIWLYCTRETGSEVRGELGLGTEVW